MREAPLMTHDQMVAKWMENPDFRKAASELNSQYAVLDEAIAAREMNSLSKTENARKVSLSLSASYSLEKSKTAKRCS